MSSLSRARATKRAKLEKCIEEQQRWIAEHGGDEFGYVARYGAATDPDKYGDGGEAIFAADMGALIELERMHGRT